MNWLLPSGEPFVGAHYCLWYKGDWADARRVGTRAIYSPARGSYQSSDIGVMKQHLEEASEVGINTFCCSWKPPEATPGKVPDGITGYWNATGIENYENENLLKLAGLIQEVTPGRLFIAPIIETNRLQARWMSDQEYTLVNDATCVITEGEKRATPWPSFSPTRRATLEQFSKVITYLVQRFHDSLLRIRDTEGTWRYAFPFFTMETEISFDEETLRGFRQWALRKHGTLDAVNKAWGTAFGTLDQMRPASRPGDARREDSSMWFREQVDLMYDTISDRVKRETGYDIALIGCSLKSRLSDDIDGSHVPERGRGIAGFWDYGYPMGDADHSIYELERGLHVKLCREHGKFVSLTCSPGFDGRYIPYYGKKMNDHDPRSPEKYSSRLGTLLGLMPDGLCITSYNEWWESTAIEPAVEYGRAYLDITRRYVTAFKAYRALETTS